MVNTLKTWLNKENKFLFKMKFNERVFYKRIVYENRDIFSMILAELGAFIMCFLLIDELYFNRNLWIFSSFAFGGIFILFAYLINLKGGKNEGNSVGNT